MKHIKSLLGGAFCAIFFSGNIHAIGFGKYNLYPPDALYEHPSIGPIAEKLISIVWEFQQSNKDLVQKMRERERSLLFVNPEWKELSLKESDALREYRKYIETKEFKAASEKHSNARYKASLHPKAKKAYEESQKIESKVKQELGVQEAWELFGRLGKEAENKPVVVRARNNYRTLQRKHFDDDENPELLKAYNLHFDLLEKALNEPSIKEAREKWSHLSDSVRHHPKVKTAKDHFLSIKEKFSGPMIDEEDLPEVKAARKVVDNLMKAASEKVGLSALRMSSFKLKSRLLRPLYAELRKHASKKMKKLQDQFDEAIDKIFGDK